jgi:lysophospholipid acyltransferase (LPLAT)-like uncharacterized protein
LSKLVDSFFYQSGKLLARYCLWAASSARVHIEGDAYLPTGAAVLAGWHTPYLLSMAFRYYYVYKIPALSFTPPGIVGVEMRGKLDGFGLRTEELPEDYTGNPAGALKRVLRGLLGGSLVVVAVDGPYGPLHRVRPGALWLARASGCPLIPMGFAARPSLRWPRWDRHIIPLPRARMAAIIGPPLFLERRQAIEDGMLVELGATIDRLTQRAWEVVDAPARQQVLSVPASMSRRGQDFNA